MDEQQAQPPPSSSSSSSSPGGERGKEDALPSKTLPSTFIGRHRMAAAISHLHNQINIIQEELEQLETLGESSVVCKGLISTVEAIPDPLLPTTKGPTDAGWDRWFRGAHNHRSHKRWI